MKIICPFVRNELSSPEKAEVLWGFILRAAKLVCTQQDDGTVILSALEGVREVPLAHLQESAWYHPDDLADLIAGYMPRQGSEFADRLRVLHAKPTVWVSSGFDLLAA